jgi:hypothetical protein
MDIWNKHVTLKNKSKTLWGILKKRTPVIFQNAP